MRHSLIAFLFLFLLTATACGADTPTAPPSLVVATQVPNNSTSEPASTPTTQTSNNPTIQPGDTQVPDNPTLVPSPVPSPTPVAAQLIQLMDGACCASPGWYADSKTILYIDKPTADAPTGLYSLDINKPKASTLWSERIAFYTRDFDYAQIPEQAGTRLIRVSDGKEIRVKNGGRTVSLSPDRTRIVWTETRDTYPIEDRVSNIMLAPVDFDGQGVGEAQRITQVLRGGVSGWLDNNRLLMNGRLSKDTEESTTLVYDLTTDKQTEIFTAERSRLSTISRDGTWLAYAIVNDDDPARNGLWVIHTDGTANTKIDLFGAAQWRDNIHLVIAPFEMGTATHAFYEYDVETGNTRRLTPPSEPFKIASGDWTISPDGNKIVFVNAADNNLWLWTLN